MKLLPWIRLKLQSSNFLTYTFIIFLSGFFFFPDDHLHRHFFYFFVLIPFLFELDLTFIKNCFKSKVFIISLIFLIYFGISILWTQKKVITIEEYYDTLRYFLLLVAFFMMIMYLDKKNENFFYQIVLWMSIFASISAIISTILFYHSHVFPTDRVNGFNYYLKYTVIAATYFAFIAVGTIYLALKERIYWKKICFLFITLIILIFVLLTQSRGPLLALIIAILTGLALEKRWKLICLVFLLAIGWLAVVNFSDIGIQNYIFRGSIPFRFAIWKATFLRILNSPWFGEGYLTNIEINALNQLWTHPHNIILFVLLKSGIIGIILFFILVIISFIKAFRYFTHSTNWIFLSLLLFTVLASSSDNMRLLYKPVVSWIIFWFPVAMISAKEIQIRR